MECDNYKELLIGAGSRTIKHIIINENYQEFENVTTLDNNSDHNPDVIWDLRNHPLPFDNDSFDEIHAYDVLEHLAQQGNYEFFFAEFSEYWRILKDGGHLMAMVPDRDSPWAWGDPSHKRIIQEGNLLFLNQSEYESRVGITSMSDFRYLYKANFETVSTKIQDDAFCFVLKALKKQREG